MKLLKEAKGIKPEINVNTRIRKKGVTSVKAWLILDSTGDTQMIQAGKHAIMHRTGLPAHDLRILDPLLSYPSMIIVRESAIVLNLEHIKAIITANEILLLNSKDPFVIPFIDELHSRIIHRHSLDSKRLSQDSKEDEENAMKFLPFEFVAFEACLEAACVVLDKEAKTLEQEAQPALDKLISKISSHNLERVRQIKSRLVVISGRVQKIRDELEHLLDDEDNMAAMCLTNKLFQHHLEETSSTFGDDRIPTEISFGIGRATVTYENLQNTDNSRNLIGRESHVTSAIPVVKTIDVGELEMLLEAYFVQIDGTLNKLLRLREYVDDTEDYINLMLDDKQNHLLQIGIRLDTAIVAVSAFTVVAGIFGMNIHIGFYDAAGMPEFLWTVGGSTAGTILVYVITIAWCRLKGWME